MGYVQDLTRYFRQSLIDADRACPDDKELLSVLGSDKEAKRHTPYMALAHQAWLSGQMPSEQAEAILAQRQRQREKPLEEGELVMFPRVDLLRPQGGARDHRKRRVLLVLGVLVRLDRHGQLRPAGKAPWIPREWLGPNQSAAEPIAEVVTVDAFISTHSLRLEWNGQALPLILNHINGVNRDNRPENCVICAQTVTHC